MAPRQAGCSSDQNLGVVHCLPPVSTNVRSVAISELAIESPRVMPRGWFLTARGHQCQHRLNAHLLILHLPPQDPAEDLGDLGISELNRSVKRINLAAMRVRVFQNPHDHTA